MKNLKPTCTLNGKHSEDNVRNEFTQHYTVEMFIRQITLILKLYMCIRSK